MRKLKAVFFDLDNTLHDDSAERFLAAVSRTYRQFGGQKGMAPAERLMEAYLSGNREQYRTAAGAQDERP